MICDSKSSSDTVGIGDVLQKRFADCLELEVRLRHADLGLVKSALEDFALLELQERD